MDTSILVSKILLSKEGEELGRIQRIDERLVYDTQKEFFYFIQYRKNRQNKQTLELPLKSYQPIEITDESVSIGIDKNEFKLLIKKHETSQKLKAKGAKFAKVKKTDEAMARTLTGRW